MIHKFQFRQNPKCIICGEEINFSDSVDLCKWHYRYFWRIPALLRFLLPLSLIRKMVFKAERLMLIDTVFYMNVKRDALSKTGEVLFDRLDKQTDSSITKYVAREWGR